MFTFGTFVAASSTLIASGVAENLLLWKGKDDLAETLKHLTRAVAYGYGLYMCFKVLLLGASLFL